MERKYHVLPQSKVDVLCHKPQGEFSGFRHTIGHGGINNFPLPPKVKRGLSELKPRLVRTFIQEYFFIMDNPDMEYDWSLLDPYLESLMVEGTKIVASICIKPPALYPVKDQTVYMPNDVDKWQKLIAAMVRRYSVERDWVEYWEIGNEGDIGETGGCPYLTPKPEQYNEYYRITATAIKAAAPEVKIGGMGAANSKTPLIEGLLAYCKETSLPLDFISWHVYNDNSDDHAANAEGVLSLIRKYYPKNPPMTMVTEFGKGFDSVCVEESAFDSYRAATVMSNIFSMMDTEVDYTFYYHIWDQVFLAKQFSSFYEDPEIMLLHWNRIPHRMGLFGVCGEARPTYFAYKLLGKMAGTQIEAASSQTDLRVKSSIGENGTVSTMLVNYNLRESRDLVAVVNFHKLAPGPKLMKIYRVDQSRGWNEDTLELLPYEKRFIDLLDNFYCNIYCPADTVTLITLEDVTESDIIAFNQNIK